MKVFQVKVILKNMKSYCSENNCSEIYQMKLPGKTFEKILTNKIFLSKACTFIKFDFEFHNTHFPEQFSVAASKKHILNF